MTDPDKPSADTGDTERVAHENVNFCPWCGDEVEREMTQINGVAITGKKCEACDVLFRVQVPYPNTEVKWSNAR